MWLLLVLLCSDQKMFLLEPPQSPRLGNSIFVLCGAGLEAAGTAFIISSTCVMSAYHNIAKDPNNPSTALVSKDWVLAPGLERNQNGEVYPIAHDPDPAVPVTVIPVKYVKGSFKDDWVILRRTDGNTFFTSDILRVCTPEEIPKHGTGARLHVYHCPVDLFNCGEHDAVMGVLKRTELSFKTTHGAFVEGGLFGGSSGGIYVLMSGKILAMHVESRSVASSFEDIQAGALANVKEMSEVDSLAAASDSHIGAYSAFAKGMILCRYAPLMKTLRELPV